MPIAPAELDLDSRPIELIWGESHTGLCAVLTPWHNLAQREVQLQDEGGRQTQMQWRRVRVAWAGREQEMPRIIST